MIGAFTDPRRLWVFFHHHGSMWRGFEERL